MSIAEEKRQLIIDAATLVFIEKGFQTVTMSDIVEASQISRGNLYMYFKSTEEVFLAVLDKQRSLGQITLKTKLEEETSMSELLDIFFESQKQLILHSKEGLLVSIYEFFFIHTNKLDEHYVKNDFKEAKTLVMKILEKGQKNGEFNAFDLESMSEMILYLIEGLKVSSVIDGLEISLIERQWDLLKSLIYKK